MKYIYFISKNNKIIYNINELHYIYKQNEPGFFKISIGRMEISINISEKHSCEFLEFLLNDQPIFHFIIDDTNMEP